MDDDNDELQEQINSLGLYVDMRELMFPDNHLHYYSADKKQVLTLKTLDKLFKIQITLPDKLFEWSIDIFESNGQIVASTRVYHSNKTEDELKQEMRQKIEQFLETVSKNRTRLVVKDKDLNTFQHFDGQKWCDFDMF